MFFILSHSHSSASWHTLSPSTLVTPDVGPPWPCVLVDSARPDGDRGRNQTQSLDIGDSRRGASMALAFSSTPLAPTELEDATTRPSTTTQLRLAPSNSLGHDFPWSRATRSTTNLLGPEQLARPRRRLHLATSNSLGHCHLFSRPRACNSLSHRYEIARPQQLPARPLAQSDNPSDPPLSTSSNSLSLRFSLQLQTHSDTATIPQLRS